MKQQSKSINGVNFKHYTAIILSFLFLITNLLPVSVLAKNNYMSVYVNQGNSSFKVGQIFNPTDWTVVITESGKSRKTYSVSEFVKMGGKVELDGQNIYNERIPSKLSTNSAIVKFTIPGTRGAYSAQINVPDIQYGMKKEDSINDYKRYDKDGKTWYNTGKVDKLYSELTREEQQELYERGTNTKEWTGRYADSNEVTRFQNAKLVTAWDVGTFKTVIKGEPIPANGLRARVKLNGERSNVIKGKDFAAVGLRVEPSVAPGSPFKLYVVDSSGRRQFIRVITPVGVQDSKSDSSSRKPGDNIPTGSIIYNSHTSAASIAGTNGTNVTKLYWHSFPARVGYKVGETAVVDGATVVYNGRPYSDKEIPKAFNVTIDTFEDIRGKKLAMENGDIIAYARKAFTEPLTEKDKYITVSKGGEEAYQTIAVVKDNGFFGNVGEQKWKLPNYRDAESINDVDAEVKAKIGDISKCYKTEITVKLNHELKIEDFLTDVPLPEGVALSIANDVDTSTPGQKEAKLVVVVNQTTVLDTVFSTVNVLDKDGNKVDSVDDALAPDDKKSDEEISNAKTPEDALGKTKSEALNDQGFTDQKTEPIMENGKCTGTKTTCTNPQTGQKVSCSQKISYGGNCNKKGNCPPPTQQPQNNQPQNNQPQDNQPQNNKPQDNQSQQPENNQPKDNKQSDSQPQDDKQSDSQPQDDKQQPSNSPSSDKQPSSKDSSDESESQQDGKESQSSAASDKQSQNQDKKSSDSEAKDSENSARDYNTDNDAIDKPKEDSKPGKPAKEEDKKNESKNENKDSQKQDEKQEEQKDPGEQGGPGEQGPRQPANTQPPKEEKPEERDKRIKDKYQACIEEGKELSAIDNVQLVDKNGNPVKLPGVDITVNYKGTSICQKDGSVKQSDDKTETGQTDKTGNYKLKEDKVYSPEVKVDKLPKDWTIISDIDKPKITGKTYNVYIDNPNYDPNIDPEKFAPGEAEKNKLIDNLKNMKSILEQNPNLTEDQKKIIDKIDKALKKLENPNMTKEDTKEVADIMEDIKKDLENELQKVDEKSKDNVVRNDAAEKENAQSKDDNNQPADEKDGHVRDVVKNDPSKNKNPLKDFADKAARSIKDNEGKEEQSNGNQDNGQQNDKKTLNDAKKTNNNPQQPPAEDPNSKPKEDGKNKDQENKDQNNKEENKQDKKDDSKVKNKPKEKDPDELGFDTIQIRPGSTTMTKWKDGKVLEDQKIPLDAVAENKNGHIYAPIRSIAEALGVKVDWNNSTKEITIVDGDRVVKVNTKTNKWTDNNGKSGEFKPPMYMKPVKGGDRSMLSLRAIGDILGMSVGQDPSDQIYWDNKNKVMNISIKNGEKAKKEQKKKENNESNKKERELNTVGLSQKMTLKDIRALRDEDKNMSLDFPNDDEAVIIKNSYKYKYKKTSNNTYELADTEQITQ